MDIKAREISEILKQRISASAVKAEISETGIVIDVGDGICHAYGLSKVAAGELIEFANGTKGVAFNLEESTVGIVIMGDATSVREGDLVKRTGQIASVPVGDAMIGRVVDALGNPIDGLGEIKSSSRRKIEVKAPGIVARKSVKEPMQTGLKAIDAMIPVGRGQRELIIGDKKTGKSAVAIDTIINQKGNGVICIYVAIGQKRSSVAQIVEKLREHGAMEHTIIVAATASEPAPMTFFAPYAGCAIAEEFMWKGKHALIVYDDLSKHATAYRAMSLLLRRPPGREAFPGDVFYVHSRLLERSAKLDDKLGGGSITALPIIETLEGAVDAYIPTNVISITDGQIYLQKELFNSGIRPAVNVGISVSRVGGSAQVKGMKKIAGTLRLDLAQFREKQAFAQFGSDLDAATRAQLAKGERLVEILKQDQYKPMPVELQIISIFAVSNGLCDKLAVNQILPFEAALHAHLLANHKDLMTEFRKKYDLDKDTDAKFTQIIKAFVEQFAAGNVTASVKEASAKKPASGTQTTSQPAAV